MNGSPQVSQTPEGEAFTLAGIGRLPGSVRVMAFLSLGILLFLYFVYPAFPTTSGKSLAGWTWYGCNDKNGFLHGRFVPLVFVVMLWMAYQKTKNEVVKPCYGGLAILALGMIFFLLSMRTIQPRLALVGAPFVVVGFAQYLLGFRIARHVIFPAFFLWFCIPVPGLEMLLTGRLQNFIVKACHQIGTMVGMDLVRDGSTIYVSDSPVEVAGGCSGIRSLMALTMIAAVYANYTQKPLWKKAFLFVSSFPLAVIANFFRVFSILVLGHFGFHTFGRGTWHDWAGLLFFFPIALIGLCCVDYLLNLKTRKKKRVKRAVRRKQTKKEEVAG